MPSEDLSIGERLSKSWYIHVRDYHAATWKKWTRSITTDVLWALWCALKSKDQTAEKHVSHDTIEGQTAQSPTDVFRACSYLHVHRKAVGVFRPRPTPAYSLQGEKIEEHASHSPLYGCPLFHRWHWACTMFINYDYVKFWKLRMGPQRLFPSTASLAFLVPLSFMSPLRDKKGHFLLRGVCLLCHSAFGMPDC